MLIRLKNILHGDGLPQLPLVFNVLLGSPNEFTFFRDFTHCNHPVYHSTTFTFTALLFQIRKALRKVQDKNCQSRKEVHA